RVVAAARAPAHLLIGGEVLLRQLHEPVPVPTVAHRLFSFPRLKLPCAFAISSCSSWPVHSGAAARKFSESFPVITVTRRPFQKIATEPSPRCRNVNGCSFSSTPRRSGVFFFGLTTPPAP